MNDSLPDTRRNGESHTVEFKAELPKESAKWIKSIVAFANSAGGCLVIGVNNKREITGIPTGGFTKYTFHNLTGVCIVRSIRQ